MKPLKIAMLKNTFHSSGGLEKYCLRIVDALRARGHQVTILSTSSRPDVVQVCRKIRPSAANLVWFDFHCRRYLTQHPHDVVFGFDRHFLPLTHYRAGNGCHAASLARRAAHSLLLQRFFRTINPLHLLTLYSEKCTFEKHPPRAIICNSHLVADELVRYYLKTPKDRIVVVHNGVEWGEYQEAFDAKMAVFMPSAPTQLLFIGHEWGRKGLDLLLRALALLPPGQAYLTAVGRERRPRPFLDLINLLGLADRVRLVSSAEKAAPFYAMADVAVIPSRYDPFANVTLEALAMGLFVVTTSANGGSEAITPGVNGIVLDEEPLPQTLSQALVEAISIMKDPKRPRLIRQSVAEYDFSRKLTELVEVVEQTASS